MLIYAINNKNTITITDSLINIEIGPTTLLIKILTSVVLSLINFALSFS